MLAEPFDGAEPGLAEENLQARIRGTILMTLSNKFGWLVLTTGNKSEMATGYSTLYGDMAGGVRGDQGRAEDARVRARAATATSGPGSALIPDAVLEKPPSAELRPDQKDSDSLPEYAELDPIIEGYVEDDLSIAELEAAGSRRRHGRGAIARSGRPQRVQAAPGPAGRAGVAEGVRQGPAAADHQPLARLASAGPARAREGATPRRARWSRAAFLLRHHVPARPRRARRHHAVRVPRRCGSAIATLLLAPFDDRHRRAARATTVGCCVRVGLIAGRLLFGGYATQTVGLQYTSPSTSAFITGLYVIFTPLIESAISRRLPAAAA